MSGWYVAACVLGSGLGLALLAFLARRLADRFGSDDPPLWRSLLWLALSAAGVGALPFVHAEWLALAIVVLVTAWALVGSALAERGGPLRRRLAVLELHAVLFAASYLYASSRGMLDGTRASTSASFALHEQLTQLSLPLGESVLGFSSAADPSWAVALVAGSLTRHLVLWLALAGFAFAVWAAAYLARRPLPLPGAELLPHPRVVAGAFALLALANAFFPSLRLLALPTLALCPLFVADGGALLHRWLGRLRARTWVLLLLAGVAVLLPALLFVLAGLGVVAQLAGLRELLPFAALDETPLRRPRLGTLLGALALSAACLAGATAVAEHRVRRVSPRLGSPTEVCGSTDPSVDWDARLATFELPGGRFSVDLDETPLAGGDPAALCQRAGKRLCTSDEWYLACACTYPLEVEPGTKRSTNYAFVARAERERQAGAPGPREPTAASDKRSELRGLVTGRSEVVAGGKSKGLLLAGPNDGLRDPWAVDCRHRAFLTPSVLESGSASLAAVRCCR